MRRVAILFVSLLASSILATDDASAPRCHANSAIAASELDSEAILQAIRIAQQRICDGRRIAVHVPEQSLEWVRKGIDAQVIELFAEQQEAITPDVETFLVKVLRRSERDDITKIFVSCKGGRGINAVILVVFSKKESEWYLDSADIYVQA